jgi:hypothetical protein
MAGEIRNGKSSVRGAINKIRGEGASRRVASPVGQLGLQNAGSAGAEKHANALRTVSRDGSAHCLGKSVLSQSQQREPVVATIEVGQVRGKLHRIHPWHLANESRQIHGIKRARHQARATLAQCGEGLVEAATDADGRREMGEPERVQREASPASVKEDFRKLQRLARIKQKEHRRAQDPKRDLRVSLAHGDMIGRRSRRGSDWSIPGVVCPAVGGRRAVSTQRKVCALRLSGTTRVVRHVSPMRSDR